MNPLRACLIAAVASLAASWGSAALWAADEFGASATWKAPTADELREPVREMLKTSGAEQAAIDRAVAAWDEVPGESAGWELLDRVTRMTAEVHSEAKVLVDYCSAPRQGVKLPTFPVLADEKLPPLARNNLRLLYGRWLAQQRMYEEASEHLKDLKVEEVTDPAGLLFYQGVLQHRLLERDAGVATLERLLQREKELPRRYQSLAQLMLADLSGLKEESLDHISRQMDDVHRRLDLGHAGPKVRKVEDDVIAALDKLIEEKEQQRQQQMQQAMQQQQQRQGQRQGRGQMRPMQPAQDSQRLTGKGPGQVDKKDIGNQSGWGDLPPRQREQAMQQIGKEYPAHYRDVVEQYFRKLASEETPR